MGKTVEDIFTELSHEFNEALDRAFKKFATEHHRMVPSVVVDLRLDDLDSNKSHHAMTAQGIRRNIVDTAQLLMQFALSEAVAKGQGGIAYDYLKIDNQGGAFIDPEGKLGGLSVN